MVDVNGVAGTAIGGASLLIQLFQGCLYGFSLWQKGQKIGSGAIAFQVRMEMQAARLKEWGLNWGIDQGAQGFYLRNHRFKAHGDLAVQYFAVIHLLLENLSAVGSQHSTIASASSFSMSAASYVARLGELTDGDSRGRTELSGKIDNLCERAKFVEKIKWESDEAEALKALELLKSMVDELYDFFDPPRHDMAAHVVLNSCLASLNIEQLNNIRDHSEDDPLMQGLAYLKSATTRLKARANALDHVTVNERLRMLKETSPMNVRDSRSFGLFQKDGQKDRVLVEWKTITHSTGINDLYLRKFLLEQRVKNVARLLKSDLKPAELRTLPCMGIVTKPDEDGSKTQYGIMYRMPSQSHRALSDIISSATPELLLGDRFNLAKTLSRAILFLHLGGWLHKGIRGDNILFFGPDQSSIDLDNPYIVGFEYSRESHPNAQTEGVSDDLEFNLYRHPEVQGVPEEPLKEGENEPQKTTRPPYAEKHDIYSLGIILLELGLRTLVIDLLQQARRDPDYVSHSAAKFSLWLVEKQIPKLGVLMGKGYRDATMKCLSGNFEPEDGVGVETAFYMQVIRALDTYHA